MRKKLRLLVALLTVSALVFGVVGVAFGADVSGVSPKAVGKTETRGKISQGAPPPVQHKERRDFEIKTRTRNAGEEFQLRVEQRLESEIIEGIENTEEKGLEKLIVRLEQKLAEKPGDPQLLWRLAVAYRNAGEYDKAIEVLKELEAQMPHPTARVAVLLAQCLKAKGDQEAALVELEKLLETATVPGVVYAYRAILKEELGRVDEAAEDIEKAIAAEPKDEDLYNKVGELYKKMGKKGIKVFVKGKKLRFDAQPFIEKGRTLVPIRAIAEGLGLKVDYDRKSGTATFTNPANGKTVVVYLGQNKAKVGNQEINLDVPAKVVPPGRTAVPLRFVSEAFGKDVKWFEDGQVAVVNEP